jgi:sugar phosphate isomerase/epimerase
MIDFANSVSVASYSFHKALEEKTIDIYGYLESARFRYHLNTADIWNGFIKDMELDDYRKIHTALEERGMKVVNLCCDWAHPWADDKDLLAKNNALAEKMLKCAEILNAKTVRIDLGVSNMDITEEQFGYVASKFTEYTHRAYNSGFTVGPENHWGASRRLSVQKRLREAVNSPGYGMLLHLGNWELEEGQTLDGNDLIMAPFASHMHIMYEYALRADEVLPALSAAGYKGVWSVEHHREVNEYEAVSSQLGAVLYALSKI